MKVIVISILLLFVNLNMFSQECTIGDCKNEYGVYVWSDGSKYVGYWKGGKEDGKGTYYYSSGAKFKGTWKLGKRHGPGMSTDANGKTYEGVWEKGKRIYKTNSLYKEWLFGTWEGKGYQTNGKTWKVILHYNNQNDIRISYPDFPCNGFWSFDQESSKQIFFNEKIINGQRKWFSEVNIVVEKVSETIMGVYFFSNKKQIASANLVRK